MDTAKWSGFSEASITWKEFVDAFGSRICNVERVFAHKSVSINNFSDIPSGAKIFAEGFAFTGGWKEIVDGRSISMTISGDISK